LKLVIVESPAKAKTIGKFLGKEHTVLASYGHVRDLPSSADEIPASLKGKPWARLAVDVENDFAPVYVVQSDSKKQIAELKKSLKDADEVVLATDEDREGEAISWHLLEVLEPKVPVRRITFHEITRNAITGRAGESARDRHGARAGAGGAAHPGPPLRLLAVARVLEEGAHQAVSAGRVQSVAVRLVVEREEERQRLPRKANYCDVEATLQAGGIRVRRPSTTVDRQARRLRQGFRRNHGP
jgi:DNA topoisomerase-1